MEVPLARLETRTWVGRLDAPRMLSCEGGYASATEAALPDALGRCQGVVRGADDGVEMID